MKTHFTVEGRKCPLREIREQKLEELKDYMRANADGSLEEISGEDVVKRLQKLNEVKVDEDDEVMRTRLQNMERTRHLMIWHDLSTVANHSHLVFMVACLYDPACFYTDAEYEQLTGRKMNIQAIVETPSVYIVARSSSSDKEQLCYVETRLECLQDLSEPLTCKSGIEVNDKMRFFHGDTPARQYECGQQKGGNYYCAICGASANRVYEMDYSFHCSHISLADRQALVLKGPYGKKKSLQKANKPFQDLTKDELIRELSARGIYEGNRKEELQNLLKEELHGVQRVPALLYQNPDLPLDEINCGDYEVLGFEPLHDISHHIENVLTELPSHLSKDEASELNALIEFCMAAKETKRAFDYRCALILISNQIRGKINSKAQLLLDTLVEIQEIAYNSEAQRTPRSILRFHNLTWYHAMLCRMVIGFQLKKLSVRKLYGTYFHNITSHAPIQNRLISGRSANTEEQERIFNAITNITRTTSSFHPDHVVSNILVRLQAEKDFSTNQHHASSVEKQQAHVSKLASSLPSFPNTVIPKDMLVNHPSSWQAHLERISDFLLVGKGFWWNKNENGNIYFLDAKGNPESMETGPSLHHFRSSSFKSEESYLKECWLKCLEQKTDLPILRLQIEDRNGNMVVHHIANTPNNCLMPHDKVNCDALPCADATPNDNNDEKVTDIVSSDDNADGDEQDGILGDSDVSFDNDASDDQDSDTNANKEQCAPEECLAVKDATNVKNTGKDIQ